MRCKHPRPRYSQTSLLAYGVQWYGCLEGHSRVVLSVAWSPNGCLLVSTGDDGTVRVWRANSAQHVSGPGTAVIGYTSEVIVGRGGERVLFGPIVALVLACLAVAVWRRV